MTGRGDGYALAGCHAGGGLAWALPVAPYGTALGTDASLGFAMVAGALAYAIRSVRALGRVLLAAFDQYQARSIFCEPQL